MTVTDAPRVIKASAVQSPISPAPIIVIFEDVSTIGDLHKCVDGEK